MQKNVLKLLIASALAGFATPIAGNEFDVSSSGSRFDFVVRSPSLAAWGTFYDGYDPDSAVGKADEAFAEVATCSGSTMWESIKVE